MGRAALIAAALGGALILLQAPMAAGIFWIYQGTEEVESAAQTYFAIRIWGAPAALFGFAALRCKT